ncbi:hypothetical protein PO909_027362 [Leuciscus waleckii]
MAAKTSEGSIKWQLCYDISARTWWMRVPLSLDRKVLRRSPKKEKQDRSCIDSFNPLFTLRFLWCTRSVAQCSVCAPLLGYDTPSLQLKHEEGRGKKKTPECSGTRRTLCRGRLTCLLWSVRPDNL